MSNENITTSPEDVDLDFTREIRRKLVTSILVEGEVPKDNRERRILLETLDGMDHAALTRKKIKSEEEGNNKVLVAMNTIAEIFNDPRIVNHGKDDNANADIKKLDEAIPNAPVVDGELELHQSVSYDEFKQVHGLD